MAELKEQQQLVLHLERVGTIGRLTSGVIHDLRNVIVALREMDWATGEAKLPPRIREPLALGLGAVENLTRSLQTLHEYARTGALTLEVDSVQLAAVVRDAIALSRLDPLFTQSEVVCDVAPDLPLVRGDRQKLTQVLLNLVRNALHAGEGRATVRVGARRCAGGLLELVVEDAGCGIAPEIRDRLFQPFVSSKGARGLGMGLYMARLIIESHHGSIAVKDSALGGARFEVLLPALSATQGP
jgi:signal transduction histidine kinase